ncbi:MAG: CDP-alcohol phosphatidyltransferase family protein [Erysipelotrichaceae bacterium]|nr:CDP-alcohol phosphatidyltransferase family protein [Erysipelotrichaceae bacterium]
MNRKFKLLGYYNYTVILTYLGMICGFTGIVSVMENNIHKAVICLICAGICDMFDGTVASTMKRTVQEKNFGIQIDSLSDLICFGVLPATISYRLNSDAKIAICISALYALCALIRLAYYNVDEQERQTQSTERRVYYTGMPVTLSAVFIPLISICTKCFSNNTHRIAMYAIAVMSLLFLLPFRLKKPHFSKKKKEA